MSDPLRPIAIKDSSLASLALRELVEQTNSGTSQMILSPQIQKQVKELAEMPFAQAVEIATEALEVHVGFNSEAFESAIKRQRILSNEQDYYEWMISVGASNSLLQKLFPTLADNVQIARLRRALNSENLFKRMQLIQDEQLKDMVATEYHKLAQQIKLQPYERIRELYLHFGGQYNLTQLYAVLKEYDLI